MFTANSQSPAMILPRIGSNESAGAVPGRSIRRRSLSWLGLQSATAALLVLVALGIYRVSWERDSPGAGIGSNNVAIPAIDSKCGATTAAKGTPVSVTTGAGPEAAPTVSFIWSTEGAPEAPMSVSHIAVDPECNLWVMDVFANRFLIFDLDGNLIETWGSPGSGNGEFNFGNGDTYFMNGIAFAPDGGFYVSDVWNRRVQQFDADRAFVRAWSLNGNADAASEMPSWIVVGPDGNVYVTVYAVDGIIQVFSPEGAFIRKFGSGRAGPGQLTRSGPIAFDPSGNLWTIDPLTSSLVEFSPTGEPLARFNPPEMGSMPMGLAIDPTGLIYVVDFEDNNVSVFEPDGALRYAWGELGLRGGKFLNPFSIAFDGNGGVYVTDGGSPRVQKFEIQQ